MEYSHNKARLAAEAEKDKRDMAAFGLSAEDFQGEDLNPDIEVLIWTENRQAYEVFSSLDTQWIVGTGGPVGLNYLVLYQKLDRMKLSDDDYEQLFIDVQVMEYAHLEALHKENMKKEKPP